MITQEIIQKFELQVDDTTELSSAEELDLADDEYREILNDRPWNFLKKTYTGLVASGVIPLPEDFAYAIANYTYTNNSIEAGDTSEPIYILIGPSKDPYKLVNWEDRNRYVNVSNIAWINLASNQIEFSVAPSDGTTANFDYIYNPPELTLLTRPVWPARFDKILVFAMARSDFSIQLFDKAKSYADVNQARYNKILKDMQYWNSQFSLN